MIRTTKLNATNLLELACGTGSMLKHLARDFEVSGVDLSRHMLSIARRKVPPAKLFQENIVTFSLPEPFDVICCVFPLEKIVTALEVRFRKVKIINPDRHRPSAH